MWATSWGSNRLSKRDVAFRRPQDTRHYADDMTETPDPEGESDAVMAFIRENQASVLRESIVSLEASSLADLPRTVHAIHGSLGSYQLHSADGHIAALAKALADPSISPEDANDARLVTVAALRAELPATQARSEHPA